MSSTNDISVGPAESAEAKRVRKLQSRRERERARRASETVEQREERLSRRIRDSRVRREAQSVEQRQTLLIPFCTRSGSPQTMFCMSLVDDLYHTGRTIRPVWKRSSVLYACTYTGYIQLQGY